MDIFKFFFHHDLPLESREQSKDPDELSLEDFMKPLPTYSRFYITGTRLDEEQFGLDKLQYYHSVIEAIDTGLGNPQLQGLDKKYSSLAAALEELEMGNPLWIPAEDGENNPAPEELRWNPDEHADAVRQPLVKALKAGWIVLYKERAKNGFDLQIYSQKNIYDELFAPLQKLSGTEGFRFFSINSKRIQSERKFYFETWTLDRPPHGAEEVFPQTVK